MGRKSPKYNKIPARNITIKNFLKNFQINNEKNKNKNIINLANKKNNP